MEKGEVMSKIKGPSGFGIRYCPICKDETEHAPNPEDQQDACVSCGSKQVAVDKDSAKTIKGLMTLHCPVCRTKSQFCRSPYTADECVCINDGVVFVIDILQMYNRGR